MNVAKTKLKVVFADYYVGCCPLTFSHFVTHGQSSRHTIHLCLGILRARSNFDACHRSDAVADNNDMITLEATRRTENARDAMHHTKKRTKD